MRRLACLVLAAALALAACSGDESVAVEPQPSEAGGPAVTISDGSADAASPAVSAEDSAPADEADGPSPSQDPGSQAQAVTPSPSESLPPLPLTASVDPVCVVAGQLITLTVTSLPSSGVAYIAYYAGEESGAPPPWGQGHGGNDAGIASSSGTYRATWTVSATAPRGDARVDVVAGHDQREGSASVPFEVVDPVTGC